MFLGHTGCDLCGSSDAVAVYEKEDGVKDGFCWSCTKYIKPDLVDGKSIESTTPDGKPKKPREPITERQIEYINKISGFKANKYRGIADSVLEFTGIRTELDEDGEVVCRYYPAHNQEGVLVGYKRRYHPKDFSRGAVGQAGVNCQLLGQSIHRKGSSKRLLLAGGEECFAAAVQMLRQYQVSRGQADKEPLAVVSPLVGESGCASQIKYNMEYIEGFDEVVIGMDNDQAGKEAAIKIAMMLPEGKAFIAEWPEKDINKCLEEGKQRQFIDAYYKAKPFSPSKIKGSASGNLLSDAIQRALIPKIPLPPFFEGVSELLAGGLPLGYIINVGSGSGCVDADTEFMSNSGWKRIADYKEGDQVLQFNLEDDTAEMVTPCEYIKKPQKYLDVYENLYLNMCLSDEHRVIYKKKGKDDYLIEDWSAIKKKHNRLVDGWTGRIPLSFYYKGGEGVDLTEGELRLQIAVMADGRIVKEGKDNYTQMRFSKERKYKRLLDMCKKFGLRYDDHGCSYNTKYSNNKEYQVIVWPKYSDKFFDSKYYNCSREQLEIIKDEIFHWDGWAKGQTGFTTTNKESADFVQFVLHATGERSTISVDKRSEKYKNGWCATVTRHSKTRYTSLCSSSGKHKISTRETVDGFKYCFRVPSGALVLRRDNKIFITGNSGKSTIVNELTYYWIMNSPHKVGVVSLEATSGEYYTSLLSRHIQRKIELIQDPEEKIQLLQSDYVAQKDRELVLNEDGSDRFYLLDDRGDIKSVQKSVETMVKVHDCKVIVVDPLQDILDEISTEDEARFMRWQKGLVQKYNVSIININHTRKNSGDKKANSRGAELNEEDFSGSSSIYKSGGINIVVTRDKMAEDPIVRNTINVAVTKARGTGMTGSAGKLYYDNKSHTLLRMTDELEAQLRSEQGMVNSSQEEFSHSIPDDFVEEDLCNSQDSPFM